MPSGGSQLDGLQYKLTQGNERYSSARTKKIIEKENPGTRKETPKGETNNCYGDAAGKVEINPMAGA